MTKHIERTLVLLKPDAVDEPGNVVFVVDTVRRVGAVREWPALLRALGHAVEDRRRHLVQIDNILWRAVCIQADLGRPIDQ